MKNRTRLHHMAWPAYALLCATSLPYLQAQDSPAVPPAVEEDQAGIDDLLDSLRKSAENFVSAFNSQDAAAIAALFTPLGEIVGTDGGTLAGRQAIEDYHQDLFAGEAVPKIALEAQDIQWVSGDVAIEEGLVHLHLADEDPVRSVGYAVTHARQADGSWLMAESRSLAEVTMLSERVKPLHWMIGEWTFEGENGLRIDMVIDLDDRENFLLGEALVTDAFAAAQSTNLRIGWNPATSSVYWWTFDSEGGNAAGPWAQQGADWIVTTTGITADAEASRSLQTLVREGDSMVWISTHRALAGEAQPDLNYRFVRRAPDPLSILGSEPVEGADEPVEEAGKPAAASDVE